MVCNLKNKAVFFVLLSGLFLSSCSTIPRLSKELDAEAKTFATNSKKANVYILRDEFIGAAISMPLDINGKLIGTTGAMTYIMTSYDPGVLNIVSHAENDSTLAIEAEAGKNYFVWQEVKMGVFIARTKLNNLQEDDAKKRIMKCERVGLPPEPAQNNLSQTP